MSLNIQAAIDAAFAEKDQEIAIGAEEIANLRQDIDVLNDGIDERDAEITRLKARIAELEAGQPVPEPEPEPEPKPEPEEPNEPAPQPTRFPDASNTGVPAGMVLTAYTGPMTITKAGTVIDGKVVRGQLRITASDVVVKNSRLISDGWFVIDAEGSRGLTVQDCELVGVGKAFGNNAGILGSGTFLRNDISKCSNGITLQGGSSIVRGNYIHDLESGGSDPHYDGIECTGGQKDTIIEGNTVLSRDTSCILISDRWGVVDNVTVRGNFLGGTPGYPIYVTGDHNPPSGTTNVTIEGNTIVKGGYDYFYIVKASPTMKDNTLLPKGTAFPA